MATTNVANVNAAAFGVPAGQRRIHPYARAILTSNGLVECWPCDDPSGSTTLRNIINPATTLGSFGTNGKAGRPSLLANDPLGKSYWGGHAKTASSYSLPTAAGSVEALFYGITPNGNSNSSIGGNWDGSSGLLIYFTANTMRIYRGSTFVTTTALPYSQGQTVHMCVTWNSTTQYLYLDGAIALQQNVGAMTNASRAFEIGNYNASTAAEWNTGIQWITIYNRALPADEILTHANLAASA